MGAALSWWMDWSSKPAGVRMDLGRFDSYTLPPPRRPIRRLACNVPRRSHAATRAYGQPVFPAPLPWFTPPTNAVFNWRSGVVGATGEVPENTVPIAMDTTH